MKIGVLTSSRADYGIYKPLLDDLKNDDFFQLEIISFGTHLSIAYGYTVSDIINDDYKVIHEVCKLGNDDSQKGIVQSYGTTILKFSEFWNKNKYDISKWDVSNVTSMAYMFKGNQDFNCDISNWNTSKVTNMNSMFKGNHEFNQPIGKWDVSNVTDMSGMFKGTYKFNSDI